ncbi:HNH endonuclease family protein [Mycoplasmopsis lipofaciens]|uniref:HNH endonuclease n=1 Tax=Mycoplasmopsis lipofaciens TaxID=114884 RepID=UPI0005689DAD|nr:HNH endonuclease [Mycoplasmopsis lipofaciens]
MSIDKNTALKIWNFWFNNDTEHVDFAGRIMVKDNYNNRDSHYGWNIDHLIPLTKGGKTTYGNCRPVNILSNDIKGNKTTWEDGDKSYQVKKTKPLEFSDGSKVKCYEYFCTKI